MWKAERTQDSLQEQWTLPWTLRNGRSEASSSRRVAKAIWMRGSLWVGQEGVLPLHACPSSVPSLAIPTPTPLPAQFPGRPTSKTAFLVHVSVTAGEGLSQSHPAASSCNPREELAQRVPGFTVDLSPGGCAARAEGRLRACAGKRGCETSLTEWR